MTDDAGLHATVLIELDDVRVLRDGRAALDGVTLALPLGRHTAILGPNGCGKSTFIQLVTRQLYPAARADGRPAVRILGEHLWNVRAIRSRLGIVTGAMHDELATLPELSVKDVVLGAFDARLAPQQGEVPEDRLRLAAEALGRADAAHLADRLYASLSTGEARRVLLARALVHAPLALLLDEPAAGLDVVARERLLHTLRRLAREGVTLLLVTHHAEELVPEIGHVVLLREGRVVADGPRGEVLTPALLARAFDAPLRLRDGAVPAFEFDRTGADA
ncbi:ATP-binding cassette domain-containing protein [Luteimonas viscosa]|uniref:ATP-binding cassette domain-containing protein n=1 Tax=Luteimonas viscosa TaxID=1132694 RepID=A0A5D4XPM7_9GAMM|nr:ATP-binding cassette domain-containing protein [Luteimonas viscosa]TYT25893.1 ATP-binding cassette domain-containing protein [Luteimonas viscosa]